VSDGPRNTVLMILSLCYLEGEEWGRGERVRRWPPGTR